MSRSPTLWIVIATILLAGGAWWVTSRSSIQPADPTIGSDSRTDPHAPELQARLDADALERSSDRLEGRVGAAARDALVLASDGTPISGATITLTELDVEWLSQAVSWPELDWDALATRQFETLSSADGSISIPALQQPRERDRVLWITHPQFMAQRVRFSASNGPSTLDEPIRLESAGPLTARVVGSDGEPVLGATITQICDFSLVDLGSERAPDVDDKLVFRRVSYSDREGRAALNPVQERQRIQAVLGDLRSSPWFGSQPAQVHLTLRSTFVVSGSVTLPSGIPWASDMSVRCSSRRGGDLHALEQSKVSGDGQWGPVSLPLEDVDEYVFQLTGGTIAQEEVSIACPSAGEHVSVDFHPQAGMSVHVKVLGPDDTPIRGAIVSVHWSVGASRFQKCERMTNAAGLVKFANTRAGLIWVRARAPGFAPVLIDGIDTQNPHPSPIPVHLAEAGRIKGRCTFDGKPVTEFTVLFWQDDYNRRVPITVADSVDGNFTIEEAPLGEVVVLATSESHATPPHQQVVVSRDSVAEVLFEFPIEVLGRGRVLDGLTGAPLEQATIQVYSTYQSVRMRPWGGVQRVDSLGEFTIHGLAPGSNTMSVTAPGYATRDMSVQVATNEAADLGSIGLFPLQSVTLRIQVPEETDYSTYRAWLEGSTFHEPRAFTVDGMVTVSSVNPGPYILGIIFPRYPIVFHELTVEPGHDADLDLTFGGRRFVVEVISDVSGAIPERPSLVVYYRTDGVKLNALYALPDSNRQEVVVPASGQAILQLEAADRETVAIQRVDLDRIKDGEVVPFRVGMTSRTFRVVDGHRQPIADVQIGVLCPDDDTGWSNFVTTDFAGLCTVRGLPPDEAVVHLYHPSIGSRAAERITLGHATSNPIELVLDPKLTLEIRLMERDTPAASVAVVGTDRAGFGYGLESAFSGADGRVKWSNLSAGEYKIQVRQPGYWYTEGDVHLTDGAAPFPIQVRRLGGVELHVKDTHGKAVGGAAVELRSLELDALVTDWIGAGRVPAPTGGMSTGVDGRVSIRALPNGDYAWTVIAPNGAMVTGSTPIPPQGVASVDVVVP